LKTCLKGEAELLIRSLTTTAENFGRAWRILGDYYENKRLLVRSHIAKFTALQKMKGESASELRKLYHCMVNTVGSLESLGRPITRGEDLFVHLVVELLDSRSRREWKNVLSDTTDPPSYAELQQFLDRRLHTLESLQPIKTETNSPSANTGRQARVQHAWKPENKRGRCSMCQQDHYIMFCDVYKTKSASERKQHVETNNLCLNCLGRHKVSDCASKKGCSACGARHHSTIHDACNSSDVAKSSHAAHRASRPTTAVLLATARVRVVDRFGAPHRARDRPGLRGILSRGINSSATPTAAVTHLDLGLRRRRKADRRLSGADRPRDILTGRKFADYGVGPDPSPAHSL